MQYGWKNATVSCPGSPSLFPLARIRNRTKAKAAASERDDANRKVEAREVATNNCRRVTWWRGSKLTL